MSSAHSRTFAEADEVADYIVATFAAENGGVAEVIPASRIESELREVVAKAPAFDESEYDDLYVDVTDAVLERGVIIA